MQDSSASTSEKSVLESIFELAEEDSRALLRVLSDPSKFYRVFSIPKRSGGLRTIESPYPFLSEIQRTILRTTLANVKAHPSACAYVGGKSFIDHAAAHCGNEELLLLDIKDFFGSITKKAVFISLIDAGILSMQAFVVSQLCCLNDHLPQGACTSPLLSNLVFNNLDKRLEALSKSLGLTYTRYADDLAISGTNVPRNLHKTVSKMLAEYGFLLNEEKIKFKLGGAKKIVTGVSITNEELRVPRAFKRRLRAQIFELEKHAQNISRMPDFDPFVFERIIGRINYVLQVEPENRYAIEKKRALLSVYKSFLISSVI